MKTKDALTAIKEILPAELHWLADPLADLTIWAYDKGWSDCTGHWANEKERLQRTRNPTKDT